KPVGHVIIKVYVRRSMPDDLPDRVDPGYGGGHYNIKPLIYKFLPGMCSVDTIPVVKTITVGISGASGAVYAQRLLMQLEDSHEVRQINLVVSGPGRRVISDELDVSPTGDTEQMLAEMIGRTPAKIIVFHPGDIGAAIASGSYPVDAMVIIPCSASTLGVLASGSSRNLLHRAADVCLKEGRRLVIVPRETPLSTIHLENMLRLRQAGAMIVPAMPAFYHRPADIVSMVDHFVYRVMDHLGLAHSRQTMWQGDINRPV
ncbi:MAG TPA: UbiX family flavin prenyltransferase, partial [Blastocatellia bacterium]|nr:UbiX family flavin prenyltransferase [Blastocatellia bacterium]